MLGTFRQKIISWGAKILFGLLIISFGMWGIGDHLPSAARQNANTVATVGEVEISRHDVSTALRREMVRLRQLLGATIDSDQARAMGLVNSVLESQIQLNLFSLAAQDLGLMVDDRGVRRAIQSDQNFSGPAGQFDRQLFERIIQQNGYSEGRFVNSTRGDMIRRQYLSSIQLGRVAPKTLAETVYRFRNEKRVAEVLQFNHDGYVAKREPDSAALEKFHKERKQQFTAPEYRKLTTVEIKAENLVKDIILSEAQIRTAYENRLDEFSEREKRKIRQIILPDEAKAKAARARLAQGEDFAKVAKEAAGMEAATTELGNLMQSQIPLKVLAEKAFSMKKDEISAPVKSDLGWHILNVTEISPASQKTLAEVRDVVKKAAAKDLAVDAMVDLANKFEDTMGAGSGLEEAAGRHGLEIRKLDGINSLGLTAAGAKIKNVGDIGTVVRLAFETAEGEESNLTEVGDEGYVILRVDGVTAPRLRPLKEVRRQVVDAWKQEQRAKLAEQAALKVAQEGGIGADLKKFVSGKKITHRVTEAFARNGLGLRQALPPALVGSIFTAKRGDLVTAAGPGAYYVAQLKDVVEANPSADRSGLTAVRNQLGQSVGSDLVQQLATALRTRHAVQVNDSNLDQIY